MSKQLAISATFSIFAMAAYALIGTHSVRQPGHRDSAAANPIELSAPAMPDPAGLLPASR